MEPKMGKISPTMARRRKHGSEPFVHICEDWLGERKTICRIPVRLTTPLKNDSKLCTECLYLLRFHVGNKRNRNIEGAQKYLLNSKAFKDTVNRRYLEQKVRNAFNITPF